MLIEWLYDVDEINERITKDVNDIIALYTMRQIINANIHPIYRGELIENRADGAIYATNFSGVVWRIKSDPDEVIPSKNSVVFIYVFKDEHDYVLEQRIDGVPLRNTKFKTPKKRNVTNKFEDLFSYLVENYRQSEYEINDDSIVVNDALKLLNTSFRPNENKTVMERLYDFLRYMCLRDGINSIFLNFFNQSYPNIAPEIPTEFKNEETYELELFVSKYNPWSISIGYNYLSNPKLKFNPKMPFKLYKKAKELLALIEIPLLSAKATDFISLYRNAEGISVYTLSSDYVNGKLRAREPLNRFRFEDYKDIITALYESESIKVPYVLYRGVITDPFKDSMILEDHGFLSKTNNKITALEFSRGNYIMEIIYPPGTHQLYIDAISQFKGEREFITYPGEVLELVEKIEYYSYTLLICKWLYNKNINVKLDTLWDEKIHNLLKPIIVTLVTEDYQKIKLYTEDDIIDNESKNLYKFIKYIFTSSNLSMYKAIEIDDRKYEILNDQLLQITGSVKTPNAFIEHNENLYVDNSFFISRLNRILPLLNYELQTGDVISHEANEYLQTLITILNNLTAPQEDYVLYTDSLDEPIIRKKSIKTQTYNIPIYYSKSVKHLAYSDGYITLPNEFIDNNKHIRFSYLNYKVDDNIDIKIEEKMNKFFKYINENINNIDIFEDEKSQIKRLVINTEDGSINIDYNVTTVYLELFKLFRMYTVKEMILVTVSSYDDSGYEREYIIDL